VISALGSDILPLANSPKLFHLADIVADHLLLLTQESKELMIFAKLFVHT
jgi:hypothetical protein